MNVFIFSAGILCLTYYIVIIIHAGITADFAWIWPAGTVLLWGWCLVRRHMERYELQLPDWISMAGYVLLAAGICLFTFLLICDERHIITFPEKELALETKDLHVYYGQKEAIKGIEDASGGGQGLCQGES